MLHPNWDLKNCSCSVLHVCLFVLANTYTTNNLKPLVLKSLIIANNTATIHLSL